MSNGTTLIGSVREEQVRSRNSDGLYPYQANLEAPDPDYSGRGDLTPEQHRVALQWGKSDDPEALFGGPDFLDEALQGVALETPEASLVKDRPEGVDSTRAARAREQELRPGVEASDPSVQGRGKLNEAIRQRKLLRGRVPIEDAETGVREDEGIAAVGDPMTAPEEQGQTPEERDAEARWQQTAKFFRTAAGGTAIQGGLWAGALAASPAFRASLTEWQAYKEKRDANALGRDRMEAAEGLVYPSLFRDHATAMRNMTMAMSGAGAMSAKQVGQIMRAGATSLMEGSVKAAQFVASERAKGIEDDTTLGMQAAATINDALKQGVGFVDTFIGDLAIQQGRKAAGEALEQVAPQLNKIKDPDVRRKTWAAIQAASERGDKQAVFDLLNRALATNPAGAATPATESAPAQGTAASATPETPETPETPAGVPFRDQGEAPDLSNDAVLAAHQQDTYQATQGSWHTISPDMPIEVAEFQNIAPADPSTLPTNVLSVPSTHWTQSTATPGWFVLELTDFETGEINSYVKSPDGKIWGDDQVEDVVANNA